MRVGKRSGKHIMEIDGVEVQVTMDLRGGFALSILQCCWVSMCHHFHSMLSWRLNFPFWKSNGANPKEQFLQAAFHPSPLCSSTPSRHCRSRTNEVVLPAAPEAEISGFSDQHFQLEATALWHVRFCCFFFFFFFPEWVVEILPLCQLRVCVLDPCDLWKWDKSHVYFH